MRTRVKPRDACAPFLKWVGGKRALLPWLTYLMPEDAHARRHVEPFVGGGALFFHRVPRRALLADVNPDLIATYVAVRDDVDAVLDHLEWLESRHGVASVYYRERDAHNAGQGTPVQKAARFIYLNRAGFNGLHRVNRRGELNVPEGRHATLTISDPKTVYAASIALAGVELRCGGFDAVLQDAGPGDFVYLDPPYVPLGGTSSFTAYAEGGFGDVEQMHLRDTVVELTKRGCAVMLSNSDTTKVRTWYRDFHVHQVRAPRSINSDGTRRGEVPELVVTNYEVRNAT